MSKQGNLKFSVRISNLPLDVWEVVVTSSYPPIAHCALKEGLGFSQVGHRKTDMMMGQNHVSSLQLYNYEIHSSHKAKIGSASTWNSKSAFSWNQRRSALTFLPHIV